MPRNVEASGRESETVGDAFISNVSHVYKRKVFIRFVGYNERDNNITINPLHLFCYADRADQSRHSFSKLYRKIQALSENHTFITGISPLVVTAIHEGHQTRNELTDLFNLSESERLREEDPFTARWLNVSDNRITVNHSRFETDVNRPREQAVYIRPEDAWGLKVWKQEIPDEVIQASLRVYDGFYEKCKGYFDRLFTLHDKIIVYDIHSYNHRRESETTEADPAGNPEINIGTKNMDRQLWDPVICKLIEHFSSFNYDVRNLDARENIKFKGGYFGQWLFEQYGQKICPVSIEFKKFFMNEWTGEAFDRDLELINQLLQSSKTPVLNALKEVYP